MTLFHGLFSWCRHSYMRPIYSHGVTGCWVKDEAQSHVDVDPFFAFDPPNPLAALVPPPIEPLHAHSSIRVEARIWLTHCSIALTPSCSAPLSFRIGSLVWLDFQNFVPLLSFWIVTKSFCQLYINWATLIILEELGEVSF